MGLPLSSSSLLLPFLSPQLSFSNSYFISLFSLLFLQSVFVYKLLFFLQLFLVFVSEVYQDVGNLFRASYAYSSYFSTSSSGLLCVLWVGLMLLFQFLLAIL